MRERAIGYGCTIAVLCWAGTAWGQSAADLDPRITIDGRTTEYTPLESVFRTPELCDHLALPDCETAEEPLDDSSWSPLQDVHQIHVTWDATRLYVAVSARISGHALLLLLDHRPGGLADLASAETWRRGLSFGSALRPDAFVAVRDGEVHPEVWLVDAAEALQRVASEEVQAVATFRADATGRALEAAIPWELLFPEATFAVNPDPLAPQTPMFRLPVGTSLQGLRLAAVVVHREVGFSAPDVAPNASLPLPFDVRQPVVLDRAVRVDLDAGRDGFVDFGAAVQTQNAARFDPPLSSSTIPTLEILEVRTFDVDHPSASASGRILLADAGRDLEFAFDMAAPQPERLYLSASIFSMRGERVRELYRDQERSRTALPDGPFGHFGRRNQDRWDGRDRAGTPVPGGMYVLRVSAGTSPGVSTTRRQQTIVVVR